LTFIKAFCPLQNQFCAKAFFMNTALWIAQLFLALVFLYSGVCKATLPEQKLVTMGQTGVEHLNASFIKFIGISELLGVAGLLLPWAFEIVPVLTPVAAFCLGVIMIPAALIHYRRGEKSTVLFNSFILLLCLWVGVERWPHG
jgi:uncharacterized membrane protein YphA (DoxX/SURF4 family)